MILADQVTRMFNLEEIEQLSDERQLVYFHRLWIVDEVLECEAERPRVHVLVAKFFCPI